MVSEKKSKNITDKAPELDKKIDENSKLIHQFREDLEYVKSDHENKKEEDKVFRATYQQELDEWKEVKQVITRMGAIFSFSLAVISLVFTLITTMISSIVSSKNNFSFNEIAYTLLIIAGIMLVFTIIGILTIIYFSTRQRKKTIAS